MPPLKTVGAACDAGCCLAVADPELRSPNRWGEDSTVYVRPMFHVIQDVVPEQDPADFDADSALAMDVPAAEYRRADRIFL